MKLLETKYNQLETKNDNYSANTHISADWKTYASLSMIPLSYKGEKGNNVC